MKVYILAIVASDEEINKIGKTKGWPKVYRSSSNQSYAIVAASAADARNIAADGPFPEPWFKYEGLTTCEQVDLTVPGIILTESAQG